MALTRPLIRNYSDRHFRDATRKQFRSELGWQKRTCHCGRTYIGTSSACSLTCLESLRHAHAVA